MRHRLVFFVFSFLFLAGATFYECNGVFTNTGGGSCKEIYIPESNAEGYKTLEQIEKEQWEDVKQQWINSRGSVQAAYSSDRKLQADVRRVIDGDTIEVSIGGRTERVRYIGIDCPESKQEFGKEATEENKNLLSSSIELELDVQERDRYGRLLAYVWNGSTMVNEELVRRGYCMMATYPPNVKYVDRFKDAQRYARENKEGVWKQGGLSESPYEFRKKHKRHYSR